MRCLCDIPSDRLMVECAACRRRGSYRLERLVARHGASCELRAFLAEMRARCGATPCQAHLVVPLRLDLDRKTAPHNVHDLEIWTSETMREMELGRLCNLEIAVAAFDKTVALWPHSIIILRHKAHLIRAHRPEEIRAQAAQARIFKSLGLR